MNNKLLTRLENIRDVTNDLNKSQLQYIGLFGNNDKYELYLFPESSKNVLDWYDAINCAKILNGDLPTMDELQYLYDNFRNLFTSTIHWSSTYHMPGGALTLNFNSGNTNYNLKNFTYRVRFVRRVYC